MTQPPEGRHTAREAGRILLVLALAMALLALMLVLVLDRLDEVAPAPRGWARPSRVSQLEQLPLGPEDVVFLGASLVEHGEWSELLPELPVRNRGVAGDTVDDVLARIGPIVAARPRAVIVQVGLNDLLRGAAPAEVSARHRTLVQRVRSGSPDTRLVLVGLLPVRREGQPAETLAGQIREVNGSLADLANELGARALDLGAAFADADGRLAEELTIDGVHLTGPGYLRWAEELRASGVLDGLDAPASDDG